MRKKLFAIVMSMTMVASFMPSLAFAAGCNYPTVGNGDETYTWEEVQALLQSDDAKYVVDVVAPEHGKNGSFKLVCKEDFCGEVTPEKTIQKPCSDANAEPVTMWKEEYAAKALEQDIFKNEAQAAQWLKNNADKCRAKVNICKKCDKIVGDVTPTNHTTKPVGLKACQSYNCDDCGKTVKGSNHTPTKPTGTADLATKEKVSDPTCGHGTGYKVKCSECGEDTVWYNDPGQNVTGVNPDKKSDAHNFGSAVAAGVAAKETKDGYEVLPGYVAKKQGVEEYVKPGDPLTVAEYNAAKFYELNTVVTEGTDCTSKRYGLKCTVCGEVVVNNVAGEHDYEETLVPATCDSRSKVKKVCKVCGYIDVVNATASDDALAHNYKVTKTDATCTSGEKYTIECTTCSEKDCATAHKKEFDLSNLDGLTLVDNTGKDSVIYSWSGLRNELKGSKAIELVFTKNPSKVHKYGDSELLKAATCTTDEVWGKKCTECGKVNHALVTVKTNTKLGHNFADTEVAATCGTAGYKTSKCSTCGEYKAAVGTTKNVADALKTQTAAPVVALGASCTADKWVVTKKATVFEEGVKSLVCSVCGAKDGAKTVVAKAKYAAPAVKAGKKSATVTVKATADAVSYKISYKKAGGSYKTIAAKAGKKTIKKLAKGKKYTFKAIAVNAEGVEVASATKTVKVK